LLIVRRPLSIVNPQSALQVVRQGAKMAVNELTQARAAAVEHPTRQLPVKLFAWRPAIALAGIADSYLLC
jgi:hypothetical protein